MTCLLVSGADRQGGGRTEEDLMQVWWSVMEVLKKKPVPADRWRPWMEVIKETQFNFNAFFEEEDDDNNKPREVSSEEDQGTKDVHEKLMRVQKDLLAAESSKKQNFVAIEPAAAAVDSDEGGAGFLDPAAARFVPLCRPPMPDAPAAPSAVDGRAPAAGVREMGDNTSTQVQAVDMERLGSIKLTSDVLKWYRKADRKISELFLCRLHQLAAGERSRILSKRLVGSKNFAIFETYLDQGHSAQRILFTEVREPQGNAILIWYVARHKHVSRYMEQIDKSCSRLNKSPEFASLFFSGESEQEERENVMFLGDDTVLLDPGANTPLKLYDTDLRMLTSKENTEGDATLRLTSAEKAIMEMPGTVLVLGRAGTGKTICIAKKMTFDRSTRLTRNQLFVARSPRICQMVGSLQGSIRKPPSWIRDAVGSLAWDDGSEVLMQTLDHVIIETSATLGIDQNFPPSGRVDYNRFKTEIFPLIKRKVGWIGGGGISGCGEAAGLDSLVLWTAMRSFIKGSIEAVHGLDRTGNSVSLRQGEAISLETFLALGEKRVRLTEGQQREAFQAFSAVCAIYKDQGLWDDADLVLAIIRALEQRQMQAQHAHDEPASVLRMFDKVYVDEVQDLTSAELSLLLRKSVSLSLFLAGDPAQSVVEGVDFRFADVRSVFYQLAEREKEKGAENRVAVPQKPMTLQLNFRSHAGILAAAGNVLEWLLDLFPGACERLPNDEGLCQGPRPGLAFWTPGQVRHLLKTQGAESGLVLLTLDHHLDRLKQSLDIEDSLLDSVFGIRDAKGLDFQEVVILDFFQSLDTSIQKGWKQVFCHLLQLRVCSGYRLFWVIML